MQRASVRPTHAFHVVSGLLRAYFVDEAGKEHTFMFAPEGWTIGDLEATGFQGPTRLVIEALEASEVEWLPLADLGVGQAVLEANFQRMIRRAGALQRRVLMMMSTSALERYEFFLATYPQLEGRLSQKHIASYLGITPQALSRLRARRVGRSNGQGGGAVHGEVRSK